ncbi:MAG: CPBP family intramembrane metalloprotease [Chloroflexi bacterium]|nr:CPBP family intramembrane metalloprotease [Chloroflexota bacterium]
MNAKFRKITTIAEVALVTFVLVPYLTLGVNRLFPHFESWQTDTLGFPFPVFVYVVMVALSLFVILLRGRKLADYGIHFRELKYQLDIAAACFIPVVLSWVPLGMGVDHTTWSGAIIMAVMNVGLLLVLALILRKKTPLPALGMAAVWVLLWPSELGGAQSPVGKAIVLFLTYALFVGFGEEILFRGYMQSRLNEAFGKPYHFFEVPFGWGAVITALLFGFMHIGILRWILGSSTEVALAWGFWTVFGGLVSCFLREKSGGILAPALMHGLPQAIASAAMLFLS